MNKNAERSDGVLDTRAQRENFISRTVMVDIDEATKGAIEATAQVERLEKKLFTLKGFENYHGEDRI